MFVVRKGPCRRAGARPEHRCPEQPGAFPGPFLLQPQGKARTSKAKPTAPTLGWCFQRRTPWENAAAACREQSRSAGRGCGRGGDAGRGSRAAGKAKPWRRELPSSLVLHGNEPGLQAACLPSWPEPPQHHGLPMGMGFGSANLPTRRYRLGVGKGHAPSRLWGTAPPPLTPAK